MTSTIKPPLQPQPQPPSYHPSAPHAPQRPYQNLFRHNTTNHFPTNVRPQIAMGSVPQKILRNPLHPSIIDKLDPAFVKLYNDYIANGPPPSTDIATVRCNYSNLYSYATAPATGVGGIGETTVPGWEKYPGDINVRVYVPPGEDPGTRKIWPVHFNFHGGGWAVGDLETSAHICHHICASAPCCVIDIEYRLLPEYPFPIGIFDGLSAVAHILANHNTFSIDAHNITFGGESSGATIALILSHFFRDAGESFSNRLKGVIVGTPSICDVRKESMPGESQFQSMRDSEVMPLLDWSKVKWFDTFKWMSLSPQPATTPPQQQSMRPPNSANQQPTRPNHPIQRPPYREMTRDVSWYADLLTAPSFNDLAPLTWIATAEFDPLRDEGEAYAERIRAAGNHVIVKRYDGVPHPFMHMDGVLRSGREYVQDVIGVIRGCLYPVGKEAEENEEKKDGKEKEGSSELLSSPVDSDEQDGGDDPMTE